LETIKERLGRNVRACRKRIGLRQKALAARVGLTEVTIGQLERGKVWPEYDNLQLIADELGVPLSAFFDADPTPIPPTPEEALRVLTETVELVRSLTPANQGKVPSTAHHPLAEELFGATHKVEKVAKKNKNQA
jgi:transcriptional regulator with XRE-family HTH domain